MNSSELPESLEALMQRSIEGLATAEEIAALEQMLRDDAGHAAEFEELKADHHFWKDAVVPALAIVAPPGEVDESTIPPLPDHLLQQLLADADVIRRDRNSRKADDGIVTLHSASPPSPNPNSQSPNPKHRSRSLPTAWLALAAAVVAALVFLPRILPKAEVPIAQIVLLAPNPSAASPFVDPVFVWESTDEPAQRYDVWILADGDDQVDGKPIYEAKNVVSPLPLKAMEKAGKLATTLPKGGYQVLICLAGHGRLAGVPVPFAVAEDAAALPNLSEAPPGKVVLTLRDLLDRSPESALMVIASLPKDKRSLPEVELLESAARERIGLD